MRAVLQLSNKLIGNGFAGLVMLGINFQHFGFTCPVLANLRWKFNEIAWNASACAVVMAICKEVVQRMAEFVEVGSCFIPVQQRWLIA